MKLSWFTTVAEVPGEAGTGFCSSPLLSRRNWRKELAWKANLTSLLHEIREK